MRRSFSWLQIIIFMSVMLEKYTRLRHICLAVAKDEHVTEKRGGDHQSQKSVVKKQLLREFVKNSVEKKVTTQGKIPRGFIWIA